MRTLTLALALTAAVVGCRDDGKKSKTSSEQTATVEEKDGRDHLMTEATAPYDTHALADSAAEISYVLANPEMLQTTNENLALNLARLFNDLNYVIPAAAANDAEINSEEDLEDFKKFMDAIAVTMNAFYHAYAIEPDTRSFPAQRAFYQQQIAGAFGDAANTTAPCGAILGAGSTAQTTDGCQIQRLTDATGAWLSPTIVVDTLKPVFDALPKLVNDQRRESSELRDTSVQLVQNSFWVGNPSLPLMANEVVMNLSNMTVTEVATSQARFEAIAMAINILYSSIAITGSGYDVSGPSYLERIRGIYGTNASVTCETMLGADDLASIDCSVPLLLDTQTDDAGNTVVSINEERFQEAVTALEAKVQASQP